MVEIALLVVGAWILVLYSAGYAYRKTRGLNGNNLKYALRGLLLLFLPLAMLVVWSLVALLVISTVMATIGVVAGLIGMSSAFIPIVLSLKLLAKLEKLDGVRNAISLWAGALLWYLLGICTLGVVPLAQTLKKRFSKKAMALALMALLLSSDISIAIPNRPSLGYIDNPALLDALEDAIDEAWYLEILPASHINLFKPKPALRKQPIASVEILDALGRMAGDALIEATLSGRDIIEGLFQDNDRLAHKSRSSMIDLRGLARSFVLSLYDLTVGLPAGIVASYRAWHDVASPLGPIAPLVGVTAAVADFLSLGALSGSIAAIQTYSQTLNLGAAAYSFARSFFPTSIATDVWEAATAKTPEERGEKLGSALAKITGVWTLGRLYRKMHSIGRRLPSLPRRIQKVVSGLSDALRRGGGIIVGTAKKIRDGIAVAKSVAGKLVHKAWKALEDAIYRSRKMLERIPQREKTSRTVKQERSKVLIRQGKDILRAIAEMAANMKPEKEIKYPDTPTTRKFLRFPDSRLRLYKGGIGELIVLRRIFEKNRKAIVSFTRVGQQVKIDWNKFKDFIDESTGGFSKKIDKILGRSGTGVDIVDHSRKVIIEIKTVDMTLQIPHSARVQQIVGSAKAALRKQLVNWYEQNTYGFRDYVEKGYRVQIDLVLCWFDHQRRTVAYRVLEIPVEHRGGEFFVKEILTAPTGPSPKQVRGNTGDPELVVVVGVVGGSYAVTRSTLRKRERP